jgi:thiamine monophosphate synthase
VLRAARQELTLPILAIGGINAARIPEAIQSGADGVALISAVMAARDPAAAAAELLGAWEGTRVRRCPGTPDRLSS